MKAIKYLPTYVRTEEATNLQHGLSCGCCNTTDGILDTEIIFKIFNSNPYSEDLFEFTAYNYDRSQPVYVCDNVTLKSNRKLVVLR